MKRIVWTKRSVREENITYIVCIVSATISAIILGTAKMVVQNPSTMWWIVVPALCGIVFVVKVARSFHRRWPWGLVNRKEFYESLPD